VELPHVVEELVVARARGVPGEHERDVRARVAQLCQPPGGLVGIAERTDLVLVAVALGELSLDVREDAGILLDDDQDRFRARHRFNLPAAQVLIEPLERLGVSRASARAWAQRRAGISAPMSQKMGRTIPTRNITQ
jgi:hypothetical protein